MIAKIRARNCSKPAVVAEDKEADGRRSAWVGAGPAVGMEVTAAAVREAARATKIVKRCCCSCSPRDN